MSEVGKAVATRTRAQVEARTEGVVSHSESELEGDESPERRVSPSPCATSGNQSMEPAFERYLRVGREVGLSGMDLIDFATKREEAERSAKREEAERAAKREEAERLERREEAERAERIRLEELRNEIEIGRERNIGGMRNTSVIEDGTVRLKIPPFDEKEDLETYLCRFERWAKIQRWDVSTWAVRLGTLLRGKASDVYVGLSDRDAEDYEKLKVALLTRFRLTAESYRRKLRASRREGGETFPQYIARVRLYLTRWIELAGKTTTFEDLQDLLLMEQLINGVHPDLATFIRERVPKNIDDAATLAQQFTEARDAARDYRAHPTTRPQEGERREERSEPRSAPRQNQGYKTCFHCGRDGHLRKECPKLLKSSDAKVAVVHTVTVAAVEGVSREASGGSLLCENCKRRTRHFDFHTKVSLNGQEVTAVRDTGADLLCVRRDLVDKRYLTSRERKVRYASTGTQSVPLAYVRLESPYYSGEVEAAVFPNLIQGVIIGNVVRTREGKDIQVPVYAEHAATCAQVQTGVQERDVETEKTPLRVNGEILKINPRELSVLQSKDESLRHIRAIADQKQPPLQRGTGAVTFQHQGGLLWRIYKGGNGVVHKQIVVPSPLRPEILKMAHETPTAGHLGVQGTRERIWGKLYWPSLFTDVRRHCASCDTCQSTTPRGRARKTHLGQMQRVGQPFKKVGVDLTGSMYPT